VLGLKAEGFTASQIPLSDEAVAALKAHRPSRAPTCCAGRGVRLAHSRVKGVVPRACARAASPSGSRRATSGTPSHPTSGRGAAARGAGVRRHVDERPSPRFAGRGGPGGALSTASEWRPRGTCRARGIAGASTPVRPWSAQAWTGRLPSTRCTSLR
jgi:hypothetical protein